MAVLQRISLQPNERLDTPDARALEGFSLNDWRFFLSGFFSSQSFILTGFEISNYATIFTVPGFTLTLNDVVLFHSEATTEAAGFYTFAGTEQDAVVSLSPSATNFVEIDLASSSGTPDVRALWDQGANGGEGGEFSDTIDTAINLDLNVTANITDFTPGRIPLYKVITNSSGIVTSVKDCRNLFFRLGTGGNSPNPNNSYTWPSLPDAGHSRLETPVTATSATGSNAPFEGGDKNIKSFKNWMDAMMSMIKELKGTPYWYMPGSAGGIPSAYQNAAMVLFTGGVWEHNPPFLTTTGNIINGSNQLTNLGSTVGIANGDVIVGGGIPFGTTVVGPPIGSTVTMSANATATVVGETVTFALPAPGHLVLVGGSTIHRLGFTNNLSLNAFTGVDLSLQPVLFVVLPTTDTAISYGFGQDATTPIVPEQVSGTSASTITVATGGNYITGAGVIMVRGQTFTYTSYTSGSGLFAGVSPDPSGIVQNGDYAYQLDSGGIGYYHYSAQAAVPGVVGGISSGVERTMWLAFFDGSNTIELRNGSLIPGQVVNVGDETVQNILTYIGSPSEASTNPAYISTAAGALSNQTNYNSTAGEGLTSRISKITSMVADKAQDRTVRLLSNYAWINNTTNAGNQDITFQNGGTLTVTLPSSAQNNTVGLSGTLSLPVNSVGYITIDRNNTFTVANLGSVTVSAITAVPLNEDIMIIAYRLSGLDIWLWDGTRAAVGQTNSMTTEMSDRNQDRNTRVLGFGYSQISNQTSGASQNITFLNAAGTQAGIAIVAIPSASGGTIGLTGTLSLTAGQVAYFTISRTGGFSIANLAGLTITTAGSFPLTENVFVFAARGGTGDIWLWDGTYIPVGITPTPQNHVIDTRQNINARLIGGGSWSWVNGTSTLAWSSGANIQIPGLADSVNVISAGSIVLSDGDVAYVEINRSGAGGTIAVSKAAVASVVLDDFTFPIARRVGSIVLVGKETLLRDGESRLLGAVPSYRSQTVSIGAGASSVLVVFSSSIGTTSYAPSPTFVNTVDLNPQFQPITITAQSATGFTASWNAPTDSANYQLQYQVIAYQ